MKPLPPLTITTIGSLPFLTDEEALSLLEQNCPYLPAWPQLVRRHPREDMLLQATDGLPLLSVDEAQRKVTVQDQGRPAALTTFYEHFLAGDYEYFAIPETSGGRSLEAMIDWVKEVPSFGPEFLKAQISGPVSFGESIRTSDEKTLLDDPELKDTVVKGLAAKAAWLAGRIRDLNRIPLIFIDEPGLTGFGSAFSSRTREEVIEMINEIAEIVRSGGEALLGIHVCGNTDWGMLAATTLDVINFDAFSYLDHFLLYPRDLNRFFQRGGYVAWGIVPTVAYTGRETPEGLADQLIEAWRRLTGHGLEMNLLRDRALITPSCGLGSLTEENARAILSLLPQAAQAIARRCPG